MGAVIGAITGAVNPRVCFAAGTLIAVENGQKKIEDIEEGDLVWAYDERTGEKALKPVVRLFRNETKEWCYVYVEGEKEPIVSTPGHKYYLPGNKEKRDKGQRQEHRGYEELTSCWVSAKDLRKGDNDIDQYIY